MQLHHINIRAPAELLADERDFFRDILGLVEGPRPAFTSPGHWLYSADRPIVHLSQGEPLIDGERGSYFDHVAFQATGLPSFVQRLESAGLEYSAGYIDATATTQIFIHSPTGTKIEVSFVDETL
jgi:catechol 2,3-dioxygenase-like lactoylglutathione lyase family enzyme